MVWKVIATKDGGYFNGSKVRKGEIIYLRPKKGKKSKDRGLTDLLLDIEITEAQQFSPHWMMRINEPIDKESDQEHNDKIYVNAIDSDKVIKKMMKKEIEVKPEPKVRPKSVSRKSVKKRGTKEAEKIGDVKEAPTEEVI